jgi:hypothetical protein
MFGWWNDLAYSDVADDYDSPYGNPCDEFESVPEDKVITFTPVIRVSQPHARSPQIVRVNVIPTTPKPVLLSKFKKSPAMKKVLSSLSHEPKGIVTATSIVSSIMRRSSVEQKVMLYTYERDPQFSQILMELIQENIVETLVIHIAVRYRHRLDLKFLENVLTDKKKRLIAACEPNHKSRLAGWLNSTAEKLSF